MNIQFFFMAILVFVGFQSCTKYEKNPQLSNNNESIGNSDADEQFGGELTMADKVESLIWFDNLEEALENPFLVEYLILRGKGYQKFPKEILQFENLKQLDISLNPLEELPLQINLLKELEELHIAYCSLGKLPNTIGDLRNLKRLDLLYNKLATLPNSIGNLNNLEYLNLTGNPIIRIPKEISKLEKLERFGLTGENGEANPYFTHKRRENLQLLLPNCRITFE